MVSRMFISTTCTSTYTHIWNCLYNLTALPFDTWVFTLLVVLPLTPLVSNLLADRIAIELERTPLSYVEYAEPRFLITTLTLWTFTTTLVVILHLFAPLDYLNTASVTAASWLSLATLTVCNLLLGAFGVILPVLLHYLYAAYHASSLPYRFSLHPTATIRYTSLDLWFFLLAPSLLYSTLTVVYKLIYFALRLWLLMTLHVFVATTLTLLLTQTLYITWVGFLLYTPLACSGYGGWMLCLFVYIFGNVLYLSLQFLVYLGYKLDAFLEAQHFDHVLFTTFWSTLLSTALVCLVVGFIAVMLSPLLPHLVQTHATQPWTSTWRTTLQTYECGNPTTTTTTPVDTYAPPSLPAWFLLLDTLTLFLLLHALSTHALPDILLFLPLLFVFSYASPLTSVPCVPHSVVSSVSVSQSL